MAVLLFRKSRRNRPANVLPRTTVVTAARNAHTLVMVREHTLLYVCYYCMTDRRARRVRDVEA